MAKLTGHFEPKPNFSQDRLDAELEKQIAKLIKTDPFCSYQSNRNPWSPKEIQIMKKCVGRITYKAIRKNFLPTRTLKSIKHKARDLRDKGEIPESTNSSQE